MNLKNKTKLIVTFGPSLDKLLKININNIESLNRSELFNEYNKLVNAGVNVFRFNMSHDNIKNHEIRFNLLRECNSQCSIKSGILIDTKGPEIRVQNIQNNDLTNNIIYKNDLVEILCNEPNYCGNAKRFSVSDSTHKYHLSNDVNIGDEIMIDDGKLILKIKNIDREKQIISAISLSDNYQIKTYKRINLFNKKYSLPFLSEYDIETIRKAVIWDADFLALSFVSNLEQINEVKKIIKEINPNSKIKIIAKIETYEALENLESIIKNTHGAMVARGDLALEIGWHKTTYYQDQIVNICNKYKKISIVATQMLDSLERQLIPTRAEVTDCYYATKILTDSTMLSGESASGIDPFNAILAMKKICEFAFDTMKPNIKLKFIENIYLKLIYFKINNKQNVILKNFSEDEIRLITKKILHTNFYLESNDFENFSKLTLYSNLSIINKLKNDYYILDKKNIKLLKIFDKI